VLGHSSTTEEIVNQAKASDQWAYYQAKSIRRYESEIARDMMAAQVDKAAAYTKNMERYEKEGEDIQKEAQGLEKESSSAGHKAERYEFGEVFFEVSIVMASVAILTKRKPIWWVSIAGGLVGLVVGVSAYMIK
jgi:Flp pilus assembly protein TadB